MPGGLRECGVCWYVYDPAQGDEVWQVPQGTPFEALPEAWRCPRCDSGKERFLPPREEDADPRVSALEAAYREIGETKMKDLPLVNPKLSVQAVGFRPWGGGLFGALVTPWSINAIFFPPEGPEAPPIGRTRTLPSGEYTFFPQPLGGVGTIEQASIFSPTLEFEDQAAAVTAASAAVEAMLAPEAPPPPKSRRDLFPFLARGPR